MASKRPASVKEVLNETRSVAEDSLLSMENLDRTSPQLWPEKYPGVNKFINSVTQPSSAKPPYSKTFNSDDNSHLNELAGLSTKELIAQVKTLHDCAYQLGVEEAKEMTRGKYLNMFNKPKRSKK